MWNFVRKHDGAISVFLTLILIPTLLFAGVLVDGVRIYGSKNIISGAGDLAMNGALAGYDGDLNDAYGLIAMSKTPEELNENLQDYFEATLSANGLTTRDFNKALINLELLEGSFQAEGVADTEIWQTGVMRQEVLEYMKYRAPVTFVNRFILEKLDQFKHIDKERKAADSQVEFQSELGELQEDYDELLELVEEHTGVYRSIPSTGEISAVMQETKNAYTRMCMLSIGYGRIIGCQEAESGELLSLHQQNNDAAVGCGDGIDGFESLLRMKKLDAGMDGDLRSLLDGLDPDSEEYREINEEISAYGSNSQMWAEQVEKIRTEYEELSAATYTTIRGIYELAEKGCDSAEKIQKKYEEMERELEKCSNLYGDWQGAIGELPETSETKTEMSAQAEQYGRFFSRENTEEFTRMIENNKSYYEQVKSQLEKMQFAGSKVVETQPSSVIDPAVEGVLGSVNTKSEMSNSARDIFTRNWPSDSPYRLSVNTDKQDIETTEFVKYLREELCKPDTTSNEAKSKEEAEKWDGDLGAMLEEYKTLFLSDDISAVNLDELGGGDLPTDWLQAAAAEAEKDSADIEGGMGSKDERRKVSDSARDAMNTDNSSLSLLSGLADAVHQGAEAVYMTEYVMGMLSYYTVNRDAEGNIIGDPLSLSRDSLKSHQIYRAEVEYVIWGDPDVRDNVTKTKATIFAIQFVCNVIFALTNSTLVKDAGRIASLFPLGVLGRAAIQIALLSAVALIETTGDLNQLVKGESVDLIKSNSTWETWITTRGGKGDGKPGPSALRYEDYLWLLTCIQLLIPAKQEAILGRTADCIELNRTEGKSAPDNSLKDRFTMVKISADVRTDTFFLQKIGGEGGPVVDENTFVLHYKGIQGY